VKSRPGSRQGEPIRADAGKPITLGGQHRSDDRARQVFGDGMHGSSCHVNQGDLSGERLVFIGRRIATKSQPDRSQSTHSSVEAG
jgi:hypothetical protein